MSLARWLAVALSLAAPLQADTLVVPSAEFATIQAAIDAAQPGDTVLVSKGTYVEPVKVADKTDFVLRAKGKVVLEATDFNSGITVVGCTGVEVRGFTIVNSREHSILVLCSDDLVIRKCRILGGDLDGIRVFSGSVTLEKNTVKDVEGSGIRLQEPVPGDVQNPDNLCGAPVGVVLRGNRIENVGADGLSIRGTDILAESNVIEDVGGDGLVVLAEGAGATLRKNRILSPAARGLVVQAPGVTLEKNRIKKPVQVGLLLGLAADGASAQGDRVTKPAVHGVQVEASSCTLAGLRVVHAGGHGFLAGGADNAFTGCRSTSAWFAGFDVYSSASTFTNCHATGSGLYDLIDVDPGNSTNTYDSCNFGTTNIP